jgi:hypothetical protein
MICNAVGMVCDEAFRVLGVFLSSQIDQTILTAESPSNKNIMGRRQSRDLYSSLKRVEWLHDGVSQIHGSVGTHAALGVPLKYSRLASIEDVIS